MEARRATREAPACAPIGVVGNRPVAKLGEAALKLEFHRVRRTIALLGDNQLGHILVFGLSVVHHIAVNEADDVGILLDRSRLPQIGQHGPFVFFATLGTSIQLGERQNRNIQFLGETLETPADFGNFLLPAPRPTITVGQLQIIDHHQVETVFGTQATTFRTNFEHRRCTCIIDPDASFGKARSRHH